MFIKNTISYLITKSLAGLILLLSVIVFTRILRPEEYAVYSISISAMNIIYAISFLWLSLSFTRFYEVYRPNLKALYSSVSFSFISISLILFFLKLFLHQIVFLNFNFELSYFLFFLVISYGWYDLNLRVANVNQQTAIYGKIVLYRALVGFILALLLYHFDGVNGIFVALIVSSIIFPILFIRPNPLLVTCNKVDSFLLKDLFVYGLPLAVTSGLTMIVDFSDRFLISSLIGKHDSGIYSASYDFVLQTLGFLIGVFYLSFFPMINKIYENKELALFDLQLSYYANILLMVALPVSVAYICLPYGFSKLFLGVSFRSISSGLIPIITIGVLIGNLKAYLIDLVFYVRKKTLIQVVLSSVIAIINVVLNLTWIPQYGSIGAAYATLFSFVLGLFLSLMVAMYYKMLPKINMDTVKVVISTLIMFLYLLVLRPTQSYNSLTFTLLLVSSILIYFVILWYLDTLKLKQIIVGLIDKL